MKTLMKIAAQFSELSDLFEQLVEEIDAGVPVPEAAPEPAKKKVAKKKAAAKKAETPEPEPVGNMPPPPDFSNPVQIPDFANMAENPATPSNPVPFTDQQGLIAYISEAFQEMGREKGQKIGDILQTMGVKQISEIQPDQYQVFYNSVETLRNA